MCESWSGGRYERVTDNLFRDHQRTGCPFVVRWKETVFENETKTKKKREKVLPLGTTEKEARKERDLVMVTDVPVRPTSAKLTLAQLWGMFVDDRLRGGQFGLSAGTARKYERDYRLHVKPYLRGTLKVSDIRPEHILRVFGEMHTKGYAPATVQGAYVLLSSLFTYATSENLLASSPVRSIPREKRPRGPETKKVGRGKVIKREELGRIFAGAGALHEPIFRLMLLTGLRPSEALGLTWDQVDLDEATLCVDRQVNVKHLASDRETWFGAPKGKRILVPGEGRIVDLSPEALALLKEQRRVSRQRGMTFNPLVFPSAAGTPIRQSNFRSAFLRAVEAAGIERTLTPHCLRHTFASALFSAGTPLEMVSMLLGHASMRTTEDIYVDFIDRDLRRRQLMEQMAVSSIAGIV